MTPRAAPGRTIAWTLLFLGGVVMVTPFVYMLATSFKTNVEVYQLSLLPRAPTLANYAQLIGASGFPRWFANSLLIAALTTASVLFFDSLVEAAEAALGEAQKGGGDRFVHRVPGPREAKSSR